MPLYMWKMDVSVYVQTILGVNDIIDFAFNYTSGSYRKSL